MTEPTILVSTWNDGLFAVTGDRCTQEIASQPVRGLAPDGRGGALALVGRHALRRRDAHGTWATVATSECELSCCMAVGETIYVGTDDARLLQLSRAGRALEPLDGFDRVPGRETWFPGSAVINGKRLGPPLGIRSVAANANGTVLFANVHVGGIPRSLDGGRTWQPTLDMNSDVHEVRAHPTDPELVVAASALGLCLSRDTGASWTIERDGLYASHCYAVTFAGNEILVSASANFFGDEGRLYRRPVAPHGSLAEVAGGRPGWLQGITDTGGIAAHGPAVAVADRAGHVYGSDDFGRTWSCRSTGLPIPSGLLVC